MSGTDIVLRMWCEVNDLHTCAHKHNNRKKIEGAMRLSVFRFPMAVGECSCIIDAFWARKLIWSFRLVIILLFVFFMQFAILNQAFLKLNYFGGGLIEMSLNSYTFQVIIFSYLIFFYLPNCLYLLKTKSYSCVKLLRRISISIFWETSFHRRPHFSIVKINFYDHL